MKLNRRLNQLTAAEYRHVLTNYRRYTDFNSLGLFRSILENEKLDPAQRLQVRDAAVTAFPKFFEFLQLKDPDTYLQLQALGQEQTAAERQAAWQQVQRNQQQLLADKRLRHRNFGTYAKHECGYADCPLNGLMIRQGSRTTGRGMWFHSDRRLGWNHYRNHQAEQRRQDRKAFNAARHTRFPEDL
ncbi:hypothetical protein EJV47_19595 [Hymenobacter gummosus]|uniref:Uncharacterized protein n=1 Tax=Hymenobacter gummosus TaxID=1776032 RepID=A0A431TY61_9BACT|nr:hypothetical protein [Hymenobacter gummosus]RTQ47103.1 hypothetical protein EJV47_19595 [Hymenobacter gummosus]